MINHPIPQNVTAYEFHLIGSMTIKQFVELGGGVLLAVLIYSTGLPDFIKWPLIIISALCGAALAFLPFDGRPLDRMVVVFIKAIYSPTQYVWRKNNQPPKYFSFVAKPFKQASKIELERRQMRQHLSEYLDTLPGVNDQTDLDPNEAEFISKLDSLFSSTKAAVDVIDSGETDSLKPPPKVRVRRIKEFNDLSNQSKDITQKLLSQVVKIPEDQAVQVSFSQTGVSSNLEPEGGIEPNQAMDVSQPFSQTRSALYKDSGLKAKTSSHLPFPSLPKTPNTLVGMVLDASGHIVDGAIIEVRDEQNLPVRALKSNKLGQFFSATKLPDGVYQIETEREGLHFEVVTLKLEGKIIQPVEIRATA